MLTAGISWVRALASRSRGCVFACGLLMLDLEQLLHGLTLCAIIRTPVVLGFDSALAACDGKVHPPLLSLVAEKIEVVVQIAACLLCIENSALLQLFYSREPFGFCECDPATRL